MRVSYIAPLLFVVFIASICLQAQSATPQMKAVEPVNAKAGDVLTATGENLDQANVAKVYLTDGKNDVEVVIEGQEATALKFKVPENVKPGRLALMILTKGKEPKLIEQPVKVTID